MKDFSFFKGFRLRISCRGISFLIAVVFVSLMVLIYEPFAYGEERVVDAGGGIQGKADSTKDVTFNFVDVELPVLAKFVSDITGKNLMFDERLKGRITIIAPSKLKLDDAYRLFTSVLAFKGYALVPTGVDAYKIVPSSEVRQKGIDVVSGRIPIDDSFIVRLIPLKHISSEEVLVFLRPIVSRDGIISTFRSGNLLLIIDTAMNIEKILKIIERIDRPSAMEAPEIVNLEHAPAEEVARILNEGMKSFPSQGTVKIAREKYAHAVADTRLNAVVLFGKKNAREAMKRVVAMLDVPSPEDQGRINVYFLENADAEELADVLNGVIQKASTQGTRNPNKARKAIPFESSGKTTITPEKSSNALIIVSSPSDYKNIVQVIRKLDRRRRQVYVEAMIVEASIDRLRELGSRWRAAITHNGEPVFISGVGILNSTSLQSVLSGLAGFSAGGLGNFLNVPVFSVNSDGSVNSSPMTVPGFAALFSLDEFKGAVNVLSTPQILTSNNKEAEIVVGENVPFITKRESDPSRSSSVFSTIERKDVGITLRITPQITEGDYVKLDIYQEISSVKHESNADILISIGPTTTKRSTNTSVIVKDNQTVVIGGLMQEKEEETTDKVPILGDLPLLGWAFKTKSTTKKKTNLIVFLTPHIIRDAEALKKITDSKRDTFRGSSRKGEIDLKSGKNTTGYVEGQLIIRFRDYLTREDVEEIVRAHGARIIKYLDGLGLYHIGIQEGESLKEAMDYFNSLREVVYAEPNSRVRIQR